MEIKWSLGSRGGVWGVWVHGKTRDTFYPHAEEIVDGIPRAALTPELIERLKIVEPGLAQAQAVHAKCGGDSRGTQLIYKGVHFYDPEVKKVA